MDIQSNLSLNISQYTSNLNKAITQTQSGISKINQSLASVKNILASAFAFGGVSGVINIAEDFKKVTGTIINATADSAEFNATQKEVFDISQKLGLAYADIAGSVTALLPPMKAIGATAGTVAKFAETLNAGFKANAFSGGASVINALAKSMNKGSIDGKAFQSVLLAIPDLAEKMSTVLDITEQDIKALGTAGRIGTADFIKAINALNGEYLEQAKNTDTIANSFNYLKNAIASFLNNANQASGISKTLSNSLRLIADNIDKVALSIGVIAGLKIYSMIQATVAGIATLSAGLWANVKAWNAQTIAIMANTRARTANAIINTAQNAGLQVNTLNTAGGIIASLSGFTAGISRALSGVLKVLGKGGIIAILGGVLALTGQWQNATESTAYVFNDLKNVALTFFNLAKQGVTAITNGIKGLVDNSQVLSSFFNQFDSGIFGMFEMIGRLADAVAVSVKTVFHVIITHITSTVKTVYNVMLIPFKAIISTIEKTFNALINKYNNIAKKLNLEPISLIDLSELKNKVQLETDFIGLDKLKDVFAEYSEIQAGQGLEQYFRQMKQDITNQRAVIKEETSIQNQINENMLNLSNGFNDLTETIADKNAELKNSKTATELQIEIERLYQQTDFSKRDNDFYNKINELQTAILQTNQAINWALVDRDAYGINHSDRLDLSISEQAIIDATNQQVQALSDNTNAINALQFNQNRPEQTPIIVKIIGNIDNMKRFIDVEIDEKIGRMAVMNG